MKRRVPTLLAATAPAAQAAPGETSLAAVLTSDKNQFDGDGDADDFDIVTEAALAVVGAICSRPPRRSGGTPGSCRRATWTSSTARARRP